MEVVSPDDPKRDRDTKRREYAQTGIPEYWLPVSP
ncbi:Uma2 family endonuclease [Methylomagnum ishizawai]|nr:Uma2 family endonuclease [Methylomagnum ishizawai]